MHDLISNFQLALIIVWIGGTSISTQAPFNQLCLKLECIWLFCKCVFEKSKAKLKGGSQ